MRHRIASTLAVATVLMAAGCSASAASPSERAVASPSVSLTATLRATTVPRPSATATIQATATATIQPSPTAAPTELPIAPVIIGTQSTANEVDYEVSVRPSATQLYDVTAKAWATRIGALIGLGAPDMVYLSDWWTATWDGSLDGYPVDPYDVVLQLYPDGSVYSLRRFTGPTEPVPTHVIDEAAARQSVRASGAKTLGSARLAWVNVGNQTIYRLVWELNEPNIGPDGEDWSCIAYLDAGTAVIVDNACIS
jgi:hypothetical protein